MNKKCEICGTGAGDDLFMAVAQERVCSICIADLGGMIPTASGVEKIRKALNLTEGKYLKRSDEEIRKTIRGVLGRI